MQFYGLLPLLMLALRPRSASFRPRLAAALAITFVAGMVWRVRAAWATKFYYPTGDMSLPGAWDNMQQLLQAVYLPLPTRACELAAGAALGLALRSPAAACWLQRRWAVGGSVAGLKPEQLQHCSSALGITFSILLDMHATAQRPHRPPYPQGSHRGDGGNRSAGGIPPFCHQGKAVPPTPAPPAAG